MGNCLSNCRRWCRDKSNKDEHDNKHDEEKQRFIESDHGHSDNRQGEGKGKKKNNMTPALASETHTTDSKGQRSASTSGQTANVKRTVPYSPDVKVGSGKRQDECKIIYQGSSQKSNIQEKTVTKDCKEEVFPSVTYGPPSSDNAANKPGATDLKEKENTGNHPNEPKKDHTKASNTDGTNVLKARKPDENKTSNTEKANDDTLSKDDKSGDDNVVKADHETSVDTDIGSTSKNVNNKQNAVLPLHAYKYIVGIDIGSQCSGYAFASVENPEDIHTNSNWAAHKNYTSLKTPTALLLDENKKFAEFGFPALDEYSRLLEEEEEDDKCQHKFHQLFTFGDNNEEENDLVIKTLTYFKDRVIEKIKRLYNKSDRKFATDIKWVIPIPSKWKADKKDEVLLKMWKESKLSESVFVCDHDAAFIYCMSLKQVTKDMDKVLIIDAGGNVSLSLYTKEESKWKLNKSCHSFGSRMITEKFIEKMYEVLPNFIATFSEKYPSVWTQFVEHFDQAKTGAKPGETTDFSIPLEYIFGLTYQETCGEKLESALAKHPDSGLSLNKNKHLAISSETMASFIHPTVEKISNELQLLLQGTGESGTNMITFLTGGFGSSSFVKEMVEKVVGDVKIIIPENPNLCCMKGAVMLQNMQNIMEESGLIAFPHTESKA